MKFNIKLIIFLFFVSIAKNNILAVNCNILKKQLESKNKQVANLMNFSNNQLVNLTNAIKNYLSIEKAQLATAKAQNLSAQGRSQLQKATSAIVAPYYSILHDPKNKQILNAIKKQSSDSGAPFSMNTIYSFVRQFYTYLNNQSSQLHSLTSQFNTKCSKSK